jgi:hypothetical protein
VVAAVESGTAYVELDPGPVEAIKSSLGLGEANEDGTYPLCEEVVDRVTTTKSACAAITLPVRRRIAERGERRRPRARDGRRRSGKRDTGRVVPEARSSPVTTNRRRPIGYQAGFTDSRSYIARQRKVLNDRLSKRGYAIVCGAAADGKR